METCHMYKLYPESIYIFIFAEIDVQKFFSLRNCAITITDGWALRKWSNLFPMETMHSKVHIGKFFWNPETRYSNAKYITYNNEKMETNQNKKHTTSNDGQLMRLVSQMQWGSFKRSSPATYGLRWVNLTRQTWKANPPTHHVSEKRRKNHGMIHCQTMNITTFRNLPNFESYMTIAKQVWRTYKKIETSQLTLTSDICLRFVA